MTIKEQIDKLEKEVKALQKEVKRKVADRRDAAAKEQARFFLVKFFLPFFEGVCEAKDIRLEAAISELIADNVTLDEIFEENIDKTAILMASPEFRVVLTTVKPVVDKSDKWIKNNAMIILEVMEEIRPKVSKVIYETDNGKEWFIASLIGIRDMLFKLT